MDRLKDDALKVMNEFKNVEFLSKKILREFNHNINDADNMHFGKIVIISFK